MFARVFAKVAMSSYSVLIFIHFKWYSKRGQCYSDINNQQINNQQFVINKNNLMRIYYQLN